MLIISNFLLTSQRNIRIISVKRNERDYKDKNYVLGEQMDLCKLMIGLSELTDNKPDFESMSIDEIMQTEPFVQSYYVFEDGEFHEDRFLKILNNIIEKHLDLIKFGLATFDIIAKFNPDEIDGIKNLVNENLDDLQDLIDKGLTFMYTCDVDTKIMIDFAETVNEKVLKVDPEHKYLHKLIVEDWEFEEIDERDIEDILPDLSDLEILLPDDDESPTTIV